MRSLLLSILIKKLNKHDLKNLDNNSHIDIVVIQIIIKIGAFFVSTIHIITSIQMVLNKCYQLDLGFMVLLTIFSKSEDLFHKDIYDFPMLTAHFINTVLAHHIIIVLDDDVATERNHRLGQNTEIKYIVLF